MARRPRSGTHLIQRGQTYHYRRVVPKDVRAAFGQSEVVKSLDTSNEVDAKRLEKRHDVEFERRLLKARDDASPDTRRARIAAEIIDTVPWRPHAADWGVAYLPHDDREAVREIIRPHYSAIEAHRDELGRLMHEIGQLLPQTPLDTQLWQLCRSGILSVVRHQVATAIQQPTTAPEVDGVHTLEWAYGRWLRTRSGLRTAESVDTGRRHFNAFVEFTKLVMLDQVRRSHLVTWRDSLVDSGEYRPNSINQRLQLVGAILRAGWRDAEMAEQNLKGIILPNPDDNDRGSWDEKEILEALTALKPHSWSAWVYLIGLTTGVRMGEPLAARVDWFDPKTNMIEVTDRQFTKAKKLHTMPIIECLREPLIAYTAGRSREEYLFPDAPRPSNTKIRVAHEASKWFGRFFTKHKIDRVFHELRDTWIEAAKHSPVERDIWEIISGHSAATVSDRYGGKKPDVLAAANDDICNFLTGDAEIKAAMLRLVS